MLMGKWLKIIMLTNFTVEMSGVIVKRMFS